jgi:hypothetical protein
VDVARAGQYVVMNIDGNIWPDFDYEDRMVSRSSRDSICASTRPV